MCLCPRRGDPTDALDAAGDLATELLILLEPLLQTPFFRYMDVDLTAPCTFWPANGVCEIRDCGVEPADRSLQERLHRLASSVDAAADGFRPAHPLDGDWTDTSTSAAGDAEADLASAGGSVFVDLAENPERFTAYRGAGARRLWHEIYYNTDLDAHPPSGTSRDGANAAAGAGAVVWDAQSALDELDAQTDRLARASPQQQLLFRAVSGMQTSINTHLSAHHLLDRRSGVWGVDLDLYRERVGGRTWWRTNLRFSFGLVLRAVATVGDYLLGYPLVEPVPETGKAATAGVVDALRALLARRGRWAEGLLSSDPLGGGRAGPSPFGGSAGLATEVDVRDHVRNISRLIDCVGCDRCRVWGKVQVTGLGTALRVLYAPDRADVLRTLHRHDLVALLQTLGRFAHSLAVQRFLQPLLASADRGGLHVQT